MSRSGMALVGAISAVGLALIPAVSLAHERRTIGNGAYQIEVGWETEPATDRDKNALTVEIVRGGTGPETPVEDAERSLRAEVRQGTQTRQLPLRPVAQQPGAYRSEFVPTRAGDYIFSLLGAIEDVPIREQFDTADGKIDSVRPLAAQQFPVVAGGPADVAAALRVAQADAQAARTFGLVGIGLGALGLFAALGSLAWRRRPVDPPRGTSGEPGAPS